MDGGGGGGGEGGYRERGTGEEGAGIIPKFVVFYRFYSIFMYFDAITGYQKYLTDVFKVNSGIFTMNPALVSLHRRGVFRQPWFTFNSFTSDFGLSLYQFTSLWFRKFTKQPLSVAIHIFRNNYPSAVDNHFICSLLDKDFCAVQEKKKKKKKKHFKIQREFSDRCSKYGTYMLPGGVVGWGNGIV